MNSELHLSNMDLKYWVNEFSLLESINSKTKRIQLSRSTNLQKKYFCKQVAIEVYLHKNAGNYALLGLEYIPSDNNDLDIVLQYVDDNEIHYESDLTKYNNYKYVGLPEECTDLIIETIKNDNRICGGVVKIPIAANCEVGSSPLIFSQVTKMLLEVICNSNEDLSLDILMEELFIKFFKK